MTPTERRCLDAVLHLSHGDIAPSYAEIAAALSVGKTSIHRAVHSLVRLGFIEKVPGKARSVRVVRSTGIGLHVRALITQYGLAAVAAEVARQTEAVQQNSALPVYGEGGPREAWWAGPNVVGRVNTSCLQSKSSSTLEAASTVAPTESPAHRLTAVPSRAKAVPSPRSPHKWGGPTRTGERCDQLPAKPTEAR